MKIFKTHKKVAIASLALTVVIFAGGVAYAYFSSQGTGTGSAATGTVSELSIAQVGAGYDSLVTDGNYVQDQTFSGAALTEFGNDIDLGTSGQLSDVVVALRNWGDAVPNAPFTLNIYDPSNLSTPIATDTQQFDIAVATVDTGNTWTPESVPSVTNVTFDFSSQDVTLPTNVVYGITYGDPLNEGESNINVALSSSATNLTVGQDAYPGNVWVSGSVADPIAAANDATSCGTPSTAGVFSAEYVWCTQNPNNPGAYGSADGADIPAVEFNVVGGTVPVLFPGDSPQDIGYAITNPGAGNEQVNTVTVAVAYDPSNNEVESTPGQTSTDVHGCYYYWYQVNNSPQTLNTTIDGNSTVVFGATKQGNVAGNVVSIQMLSPTGVNQDDCEGANVGLSFSSN